MTLMQIMLGKLARHRRHAAFGEIGWARAGHEPDGADARAARKDESGRLPIRSEMSIPSSMRSTTRSISNRRHRDTRRAFSGTL